jgi:hypothetical protein
MDTSTSVGELTAKLMILLPLDPLTVGFAVKLASPAPAAPAVPAKIASASR